jgi:Domain of unknown function (DUF4389)
VSEHPIRLAVHDDLSRARLTVVVRIVLAIPHFIWIALWGVVTWAAVLTSWFATLYDGRNPDILHDFVAKYVKYVTHVYAYVCLAAQPYPPFDGRDGYPVDLTIAAAQRQNRWTVVFRLILAVPATLIAATLIGGQDFSLRGDSAKGGFAFYSPGLLHLVAVLGWFSILARGRMSRGLRDVVAYALAYGAQLWGYLFLLTDRYPDSDPRTLLDELPRRSDPISVSVGGELHRSRLTVFFRLLLAIPHLIWLALWSIVAFLAALANWLATVVAGRSPEALHRFLSAYVRYQVHVYAFLYLIANPFPGFTGAPGSFPIDPRIAARATQNRWTVVFRLVLVIPAALLSSAYGALLGVAAVLGWFSALVTGRMPGGLRNAGALALRYSAQTSGYLLLLTDSYPYSGPCDEGAPQPTDPQAAIAPQQTAGAAFG